MKKLFISLFAIMAMVSCSEDGVSDNGGGNNNQGGGDTPTTPAITLKNSSVTFDEYADEEIISFSATVDWIAKVVNDRDNEWLGVSPTSGKAGDASIRIKAKDNNTSNDRSASICIKAGSAEKTINVTQKQKDALTVTSSKFEVSAEGGEITIEVKANIDFDYKIENSATSWIEYKTTRALKTSNLVFDIKENKDTEKRQGKITINSGRFNEEITIYQAGNTIEAGAIYVEVSCNESTLLNYIYYDSHRFDWEFGSNVTSIQKKDNGYLITLKEGLDEIPVYAFHDCMWLKSIIIGYGFKSIGDYAFAGSGVENVTIPDSVISIGEAAFATCHSLKSVTIGSGVTSIGDFAFRSCDFTSITIPNSVTSIGENAFSENKSLHSITIPESVTSIGKKAFSWCKSLTAFYGKYASSDNRCLIVGGVLNSFAPSGLTEYSIPNSVTSIGDSAFLYCTALKNVSIPNSVTSIGDSAFFDCTFKSMFIPNSVTSIGNSAFSYCKALVEIHTPDSVTSIGARAFYDCEALERVTIGRGVTLIDESAFDGCWDLNRVNCKPTTPPRLKEPGFDHCSKSLIISVPQEALAAYKSSQMWGRYF